MEYKDLIDQLRRIAVETGGIICLGCGYEHNCGIHGCAVLNRAADLLDGKEALHDAGHA